MKKKKQIANQGTSGLTAISMVALLMLAATPVQAMPLAMFDIQKGGGTSSGAFAELDFWLDFGGTDPFLITGGFVFDGLTLSEDSVGQTFTVSSGTEFDEAVSFLTNGIDDSISWATAVGGGSGGRILPESMVLFGGSGVDLQGEVISAISLTVNQLDFTVNGSSTLYDLHATVTITTVPVPAAVWLFGAGLVSLLGFRR